MTTLRTRGAAAAVVGLLTLALAGCSTDAGGGDTFAYGTLAPVAPADPAGLAPRLLTTADIPSPGWDVYVSPDDSNDDDGSGSICTFDFDGPMTADQLATGQDSNFVNASRATLLEESLWAVPSADETIAGMTTQFASCSGPYVDTSDDGSTAEVVSEPLDLAVPGATSSVCRRFTTTLDDGTAMSGVMCVAGSGGTLLGLITASVDPSIATTDDEFVTVLTTAVAKAFAA